MNSLIRMIATLLLFAIAVSGGTSPSRETDEKAWSAEHSMGWHLPGRGIRNFGEVTPTLYRGGQPSREGLQTLANMGIDVVVNSGGRKDDDEGKEVNRLGMKYVVIRWHCPFPRDQAFARFLKVVQDNPGKKIFVHCRLGDDRTGMMIASYRMAIEGWSAEDAMKEMQEFGFARWHRLICPALPSYEKHFPEHLKNNRAFDAVRSAQKFSTHGSEKHE
jgi:tyrosine-protein phosphatase SIW14